MHADAAASLHRGFVALQLYFRPCSSTQGQLGVFLVSKFAVALEQQRSESMGNGNKERMVFIKDCTC